MVEKMLSKFPLLITFLAAVLLSCSSPIHALAAHHNFISCLSLGVEDSANISSVIYTPRNSSYSTILAASIRNLRYAEASNPKPQVIVTPVQESQIPPIVLCAKENGLQIRTRSGGHDYYGLSYLSEIPFIIIDLFRLNNVDVDLPTKTAWVQTGATNGQMYTAIYNADITLGFPAGGCPTVGTGGLFSGGGYGSMLRKHGLAADNIIDARMVDVNGRVLDRKAMGEDLFWAIRGGGGASYGVVLAWRIQLVTMPEIVTVFTVGRTLEQNLTDIFYKWQTFAPTATHDLFLSIFINPVNTSDGGTTVQANFGALYLGREAPLLELLNRDFPELGVTAEDCQEVRWVQASLVFGGYTVDQSPDVLTLRNPTIPNAIKATRLSFKVKVDYVQKPIPKYAIKGIWKLLLKRKPNQGELLLVPYGGKMDEFPESALPFPHRAGNLYKIQELTYWNHSGDSKSSINWVRKLYKYLTPYVSKNPRQGYLNYRDLDLGVNNVGNTTYKQASSFGYKYFKGNFKRLAQIKTRVDPSNYFRNEQSIPILTYKAEEAEQDILRGGASTTPQGAASM